MPLWRHIVGTLRSIFGKGRLDRELDAELGSYLDLLTEEKMAEGLDAARARRAAQLELGGVEQVKEQVRDRRLGAALDTFLKDVRYGGRALSREPGFTLVATLILAAGIGATSALFATIDAALLRPLPYDHPDRLVVGSTTRGGVGSGPVSRLDYFDYRERSRSFVQLAAFCGFASEQTLTGGERPELVQSGYVTWNLFSALGVAPAVGRSFLESEEQGGADTAVISYGFWQRRFGGSPAAMGAILTLDGTSRRIVGVMPQGFRFLLDVDVWQLVDRDGPVDLVRDSHSHFIVGRLKPGASIDQAQADVDAISASLQREFPDTNENKGLRLDDLHAQMVAKSRVGLWLLMAVAVGVLLIACSNVAGLLLARGQRRQGELAMRAALGASRSRLVRQLLTESALLSLMAGTLGVALAYLVADLLATLPVGEFGVSQPEVGASTLLFALAATTATGLLVGAVPALRATAASPAQRIASGVRVSEGRRSTRLRGGLVVFQVGLSVVLLVGSGLLIRSLTRLAAVDPGFDPDGLLTARLKIQSEAYPTPAQRSAFLQSFIDDVRSLPQVASASLISKLPIASPWTDWGIWPADQPRPMPAATYSALARWVLPGYFETMRIPILAGDIAPTDVAGSPPVAVLSARTARAVFPHLDPLGRSVSIAFAGDGPFVVVGIVGDARLNRLTDDPDPAFYLPSAQMGATRMHLVVRATGDPAALVTPVRQILKRRDPEVVLARPMTMNAIIDDALGSYRVVILSASAFSALALALAALGLYGALAYYVGQRASEIGIRMALGASRPDVVGLVAGKGALLVGGGLLVGLVSAVPVTRLTRQLLFETAPLDLPSYASALVVLGLVTTAACFLPAWRATRVNPVEVLRKE